MRKIWTLCKSIIRKNRTFTLGILIMYTLSVALSVFAFSFIDSATATINDFCDNYGLPDAIYITNPVDRSIKTKIESIGNVSNVSERLLYDVSVIDETGETWYLRAIRYSKNENMKNKVLESADVVDKHKGVYISWAVSKHSDFNAGKKIIINTLNGQEELVIEKIVANPEIICCQRDTTSINENYQFGYLYLPDEIFEELFGSECLSNQFNIYFKNDLSNQEMESLDLKLHEIFKDNIISYEYRKDSKTIETLMNVINNTKAICIVIPIFILLITLIFGCLFLSQILEDHKQMIGILCCVGYSKSTIVYLFLFYILLVAFSSFILGLPIGYVILDSCIKVYASSNGLGNAISVIKPIRIALICLLILLLAILTCLLVIKKILNIDPAKNLQKTNNNSDKISKSLSKINTQGFFKLSLSLIFKNLGRFIAGTMCVASCVLFFTLIIESVASNNYPVKAVFQDRLSYDYLIKTNQDIRQDLSKIDSISRIEPLSIFSAELSINDITENIMIHAIEDDSVLDTPKDLNNNNIYPQDGIIFDEMSAKEYGINVGDYVYINNQRIIVSTISREYTFPTKYISLKVAKQLNLGDINAFAITTKPSTGSITIKNKIGSICPSAVVISHDLQALYAKDGVSLAQIILNAFAILTFFIGVFIIINMTVIQYNERVVDYAILRSLGASVMRISSIILMEEIIKAIIGVLIAYPASYVIIGFIFEAISSTTQQFTVINLNNIFMFSTTISIVFVIAGWIASVVLIKKMNYISLMNRSD